MKNLEMHRIEEIEDNKTEKLDLEKESHSVWLQKKSFRIAIVSTFTALAIVLGYLLAYLPNIELFTLTIFLSGFILGKRDRLILFIPDGMIVGFLSSIIFCFFNPLGASPLPLLVLQVFHYSLTGLYGALIGDFFRKRRIFKLHDDLYTFSIMGAFGCIGALITITFHVFYIIIDYFSYYLGSDFFIFLLSDIGFTVIHIIGNTLGFIFILPGLIQLVHKMLY